MNYLSTEVIEMVKSGKCTISMRIEIISDAQIVKSNTIQIPLEKIEEIESFAHNLLGELTLNHKPDISIFHVVLIQNFQAAPNSSEVLREKIKFIVQDSNIAQQ